MNADADETGRDGDDAGRVPDLGRTRNATWEDVARHAVVGELGESRRDVEDAFFDLEEALRDGEDLDADDVTDARMALNRARRALEEHVATVTDGTGAWGDPVPTIPYQDTRVVARSDADGSEGCDPTAAD
jgi:hypothetical protein